VKRRLLNLLTVLSVLLCVVVAYLWARSYAPQEFVCRILDGKVLLLYVTPVHARQLEPGRQEYTNVRWVVDRFRAEPRNRLAWRVLGFEFVVGPDFRDSHSHVLVGLPFWLIALAAAGLLLALAHARRRYLVRPGLCAKCGYDLRGTPDRCPECGEMAKST